MWKLYLLLKPAIDNRESKAFLLDEIETIIDLLSVEALLECIHIMYDNKVIFEDMETFTVLFTTSVHKNGAFEFFDFIRGLNVQ